MSRRPRAAPQQTNAGPVTNLPPGEPPTPAVDEGASASAGSESRRPRPQDDGTPFGEGEEPSRRRGRHEGSRAVESPLIGTPPPHLKRNPQQTAAGPTERTDRPDQKELADMRKSPTRAADETLAEQRLTGLNARVDEALADIDQWRGRAEVAEADLKQVNEDLAVTNAECGDLAAQVLPHLADYITEPFDEPTPEDGKDWPDYIHGDRGVHYAPMPERIETES